MRPESGSRVTVDGVEYQYDDARMIEDVVRPDHIEIFMMLCSVGTAKKYPPDQRTVLDTHPAIYSILLLCRAYGFPEHVIDKLTDGLIEDCVSYSTHHEPEYIWLVKTLFGRKRGRVGAFLAGCSNHCKGITGDVDDEGYPIPIDEYGVAGFIINTTKLLRKKIIAGIIDCVVLAEFLDKINRMNMDCIYTNNSETTRNNSRLVRNERNAIRSSVMTIKVGDPLFTWTRRRRPVGTECFQFPEVHVPGVRNIAEGESFITDLAVAEARMLEAVGGLDIVDKYKHIGIAGGSPSKAINAALLCKRTTTDPAHLEEGFPLLENMDIDKYASRGKLEPNQRVNTLVLEDFYNLITELLQGRAGVLAVINRRSVITLYRDDGAVFQFIATTGVNDIELLNEFDFSQVKVCWKGGQNFYMTPDAYLAFLYGFTDINTVNGYDPNRIIKTTLAKFDILKSQKMSESNIMKKLTDDPALYTKLARAYLYDSTKFEPRRESATTSDFERFRAKLESSGREFVRISFVPKNRDDELLDKIINLTLGDIEFRPASFRRTYGPTDNINVAHITRDRLAKLPEGDVKRYLVRKGANGRQFNANFTICRLESISSARDGSIIVKLFTSARVGGAAEGKLNDSAALRDVANLLDGTLAPVAVSKPLLDSEGLVTFTITKDRIARCEKQNICIISNQHGCPRGIDDYLDANVKFKEVSGEFNILYTREGERCYFELDLRGMRIYEEYKFRPGAYAAILAADDDKKARSDAAAKEAKRKPQQRKVAHPKPTDFDDCDEHSDDQHSAEHHSDDEHSDDQHSDDQHSDQHSDDQDDPDEDGPDDAPKAEYEEEVL